MPRLAMNVFQREDDDGRIFILEVWANRSLHAEHRKLPSGDEFRAFVAPHVIEPPSVTVLKLADCPRDDGAIFAAGPRCQPPSVGCRLLAGRGFICGGRSVNADAFSAARRSATRRSAASALRAIRPEFC